MPHLSKKKLPEKMIFDLDEKFTSFFSIINEKKQKLILKELLTHTERMMLSKRIMMTYLIFKKIPTHKISDLLGISSSTVARFELMQENNNFKYTVNWLREDTVGKKVIKLIADLIALPKEAQHKSFYQILRRKPMIDKLINNLHTCAIYRTSMGL